jgi:hypothetical protein
MSRAAQRKAAKAGVNLGDFDSEQVAQAMSMAPNAIQKLLAGGGNNLSQLKQTAMKMMSNPDTKRRVQRVMKKLGGKELTKSVLEMAGAKKKSKNEKKADDGAAVSSDSEEEEKKAEVKLDADGKVIELTAEEKLKAEKKKKKKNKKKKDLKNLAKALFEGTTPEGLAKGEFPNLNSDKLKDISTSFLTKMKGMDQETFQTLKDLGQEAMSAHPEMLETVTNIANELGGQEKKEGKSASTDAEDKEDDDDEETPVATLVPELSAEEKAKAEKKRQKKKEKKRKQREQAKLTASLDAATATEKQPENL